MLFIQFHPLTIKGDTILSHQFHVGMRTLKTSLSVVLVVFISTFTSIDPQIAALSSVFSQRANIGSSFNFGLRRTIAIICGAFASLIYIFLHKQLPDNFIISPLLAGLGILITIQTCLAIKNPQGVIGASATFLVIIFNIPEENQYAYALLRVLDTFIGAIVAVGVEYFLPRYRVLSWIASYNRRMPRFMRIKTTGEDIS